MLSQLYAEIKALLGLPKGKITVYSELSPKQRLRLFLKKVARKLLGRQRQLPPPVARTIHSSTYSADFSNLTVAQFWHIINPLIDQHLKTFNLTQEPEISIITPTYNSSLDWFIETVISVLQQSSHAWEWCLVDDGSTKTDICAVVEALGQKHPRIKVALQSPGGISAATNHAIALSSAPVVCFLDHDDTLTPHAIATSLAKLAEGFEVTYSDEDKIDQSGIHYLEPFYKPDWSPEYFRGVMYVGHLLCIRKELILKVGGLNSHYDGIQDYELVLRLSEVSPRIGHIPEILYHWRKVEGSISADIQAKPRIDELQQEAVTAHLKRLGLPGEAKSLGNHRVGILPLKKADYPLVSIIIPTKDAPHHLERCLASLFELSSYPNFEVLLIDNDTCDPQALKLMRTYPVKRVYLPNPFNYSRANNLGAQHAQGDYFIFLNNDTEVIVQDWIEHLLYYAEQHDVGAAGALLLFPDKTVQHAGVVMGFRGTADHVMRSFPAQADGYAGSLMCAREVSAVTAACLMLSKQNFEQISGFNEHYFHHYQDVDLCMKLIASGKRNIITPRSVLIHHESATRKSYYDFPDRFLLLDQWQAYIDTGDPYYNANFSLERFDYAVRGE